MRAVPGNPKDSKWRITPQAKRKRKMVAITLSDEARELLKWTAEERAMKQSEIVEELILRELRRS